MSSAEKEYQVSTEQPSDVVKAGKASMFFPEFYYDLIARVLPGTVLLVGCGFASGLLDLGGVLEALKGLSPTAAILFCIPALAGSYVCGILLTCLQRPIRLSYTPAVWKPFLRDNRELIISQLARLGLQDRKTALLRALGSQKERGLLRCMKGRHEVNREIRSLVWPLYGALHDYLKTEDAQARFVLPKMNGEAGLCENLAGSLVLVSLGLIVRFLVAPGDPPHAPVLAVGLLWLFATFCYGAGVVRYRALIQRHFSFWRIQVSRRKPDVGEQKACGADAVQSAKPPVRRNT